MAMTLLRCRSNASCGRASVYAWLVATANASINPAVRLDVTPHKDG